MTSKIIYSLAVLLLCLSSNHVGAREIHVSKTGTDGNSGTEALPFLSISKAAEMAEAGDVV